MTKVIVINGSPKTDKSNTAFLLNPFMEGMKKAGASVELIYPSKLKILPCIGCFDCWYETIGSCFIQDDMQDLYPKVKSADILVLATPVYSPLPGKLTNFINRLIPLLDPILEFRNGRTRARCHDDVNISKLLAVVVSGWYEVENTDLVVRVVEELAENYSIEFTGAIRRPHCYPLKDELEKSKKVLQMLEEVGFKLIKEGKLYEDDLDFISQPLADPEEYNQWKTDLYQQSRLKSKQ